MLLWKFLLTEFTKTELKVYTLLWLVFPILRMIILIIIKTFDEYLKTKKRFFDRLPETAIAITNTDDKNGDVMLQNTQSEKKITL